MTKVKPYSGSTESKKDQVKTMFDTIAGNYDRMNKLITFGMDIKWRKNVFNFIKNENPQRILDIATGTGDMLLLYSKTSADQIVGADISDGMLAVAKEKIEKKKLHDRISLSLCDAEHLPFEDKSFNAISVTYGIRNFEDLEKGLSEILRVLSDDGVCVILETSVPEKFPFKQGYHFYTKRIMPLWGKLFSKDKKAYSYLSDSALDFPYGEKMQKILEGVGFSKVELELQAQGISTIYLARK